MNIQSVFYFTLILLNCSPEKESSIKKSVFHYNQPNSITSLDPAFAKTQNNSWACEHLYNQLLDLNDSLKIVPELAKSFSISKDGLIYTFNLRTDVFFSDNECFGEMTTRKFVSSDIAYSFYRLLDPKLSAPGRWIFLDKVDSLDAFKVINDSTFQLQLKKAFAPMPSLLTMHFCSIIPKEAVEYYKDKFRENPVGTGPFYLKKWIDRQGMFLSKNENYFKSGMPYLDGIRISFIEDRNTAFLELMKKRIDFFSGIHSSFAPQLITKEGELRKDRDQLIQFIKGYFLNTEYIGVNPSILPSTHVLHKKTFRQVLNLSIDRMTMLKSFKSGIGIMANSGFIPPGLKAFDSIQNRGYSYKPDSAKILLKKLKYHQLPEVDQKMKLYTNKDYLDLITFVARQWQEIGIKVEIELMETATLREKMRSGDLELFRASWIADYPDEESFLTVFYGLNGAPPNYTRFNHIKFNTLYEKAMQETLVEKRIEMYQKMNQIIIEEAPVIFLFYDQIALFCQKNIIGIKPNAINLLKLDSVRKETNLQ